MPINNNGHFAYLTPFEDRIIKVNIHYDTERWRIWLGAAVITVREKQAELMTMVDYRGLLEAASLYDNRIMHDNMPMLWPFDSATFEYADNKAAKNSTKPGDIMVCPTLSGPVALVEVVSRKGKQQTLKVLRCPDPMMIDKTFKWHADYNNLFFKVVQKRQLKKLMKLGESSEQKQVR